MISLKTFFWSIYILDGGSRDISTPVGWATGIGEKEPWFLELHPPVARSAELNSGAFLPAG